MLLFFFLSALFVVSDQPQTPPTNVHLVQLLSIPNSRAETGPQLGCKTITRFRSLRINAIQGWPRTDKIPHEWVLEVPLAVKTSEVARVLLEGYLPLSGQIPGPLRLDLEINRETWRYRQPGEGMTTFLREKTKVKLQQSSKRKVWSVKWQVSNFKSPLPA